MQTGEGQAETEVKSELRLKAVNRQQMILRAVDVEKLTEADHAALAIWELVGRLDLSGFKAEIESVEGAAGRPAYDPQLLISLWIYAYSEGVSSGREVARRCEYHPAYQWLTGCEEVNHHSLSDFRVEHQAALDELLAQVLGVLSAEGLIGLERVMHDGTKVKALASGKSFRREQTLREHLEQARERVSAMGDPRQEEVSRRQAKVQERAVCQRVERLEKALDEMQKVQADEPGRKPRAERRVSETDPEARFMKQAGGGYAPSHNLQISTDAAHRLIVGVSVITLGCRRAEKVGEEAHDEISALRTGSSLAVATQREGHTGSKSLVLFCASGGGGTGPEPVRGGLRRRGSSRLRARADGEGVAVRLRPASDLLAAAGAADPRGSGVSLLGGRGDARSLDAE
jgi:transposase